MVVALHTTTRCPLEEASVESELCPDMDCATPKKMQLGKRQRRRVSFSPKETIKIIPNNDDFTKEELGLAHFTPMEMQLIKIRLRTEILQSNQQFVASGAKKLTPEQKEELRGLEPYVEPTKHTIALRRQQGKDAVFQKNVDAEWIAEKYQEATISALDIAQKTALVDEQLAWSTDEDASENSDGSECSSTSRQAPLYQIMIR